MDERCRDAILVLGHIGAARIPFGFPAELLAHKVANEVLCLALALDQDVGIAGLDGGEVHAGPDLAPRAGTIHEMQDVALVLEGLGLQPVDQPLVDPFEQFRCSRMDSDCPRCRRRTGKSVDHPRLNTVPRQFQRQDRSRGTTANDQNRNFARRRHRHFSYTRR